MMSYLLVALGSAMGGVGRYWCSVHLTPYYPANAFLATLSINIVGSCIIAIAATIIVSDGLFAGNATIKSLIIVGICGGYTTFSSFSLETFNLLRDGHVTKALCYIVASVILCLFATFIGYHLGNLINYLK